MYGGNFGSMKGGKRRRQKKNRWYEKGGYETVMFVDATPSGELAAECKKALESSELNIQAVERSG